MKELLKKLLCKHEKTKLIGIYKPIAVGIAVSRGEESFPSQIKIEQCYKCGKIIIDLNG